MATFQTDTFIKFVKTKKELWKSITGQDISGQKAAQFLKKAKGICEFDNWEEVRDYFLEKLQKMGMAPLFFGGWAHYLANAYIRDQILAREIEIYRLPSGKFYAIWLREFEIEEG